MRGIKNWDYRALLLPLAGACLVLYALFGKPFTFSTVPWKDVPAVDFKNPYFPTARSQRTPYVSIESELYIPLGFETVQIAEPFPILRHAEPVRCDKVFSEWLRIANTYDADQTPPRDVPKSLASGYTMNGFAYLRQMYFNDKSSNMPISFLYANVEEQIAAEKFVYGYAEEGEGLGSALESFSVEGKTGLVIGSLSPWVEAACLKYHAAKVLTVEYQKIVTDHPRLGYLHPIAMARNWKRHHEKYDFVASFSSIEHSGLGRFGDPLDPIGDIREMQKVLCLLKKGGIMFLGFPVGADGIAYNAHRIYGRIRLPMMFAGFKLLGIFKGLHKGAITLTREYLNERNEFQHVFVLQKI